MLNEGEQVIGTRLSLKELLAMAERICQENGVRLLKPAVELVEHGEGDESDFYRIRSIFLLKDGCYLADMMLEEIDRS